MSRNQWCDILPATGPGLVNRHHHPHEVFAYTIPGEGHTLVAYDHPDPVKVHFKVTGPLIWLDDNGEPDGYFDVHRYIAMCKTHYDRTGIGADHVERLFR